MAAPARVDRRGQPGPQPAPPHHPIANEWEAAGRDQGALYRGARLAAALDWTAEHDPELNELERDFVTESREASEQETRRVRRTNRRLRGLLIGVVVLLAAAIGGGIYAVVQRGQARDAADTAQASAEQAKAAETAQLAQRLGAQALLTDELGRSLLLARQSVDLDDSPQTRGNLLAALLLSPAAVEISPRADDFGLLALSPDGRRLAVREVQGSVRLFLFDAESLELVGDPLALLGDLPSGLAYSPDGRTLAVLDRRGDVYLALLDAATGELRAETYSPAADIGRVAYSPDGRLLATAEAPHEPDGSAGDWLVVIRDAATGEQTGAPLETGAAALDFAFAPDGRSVLTSNEGEGLALVQWDLETRLPTREFKGTGGTIAVSPDGSTVAVGREDGAVGLLDLRSGSERATSGRHGAAVTSVTFSPDGTMLATTSDDGTVGRLGRRLRRAARDPPRPRALGSDGGLQRRRQDALHRKPGRYCDRLGRGRRSPRRPGLQRGSHPLLCAPGAVRSRRRADRGRPRRQRHRPARRARSRAGGRNARADGRPGGHARRAAGTERPSPRSPWKERRRSGMSNPGRSWAGRGSSTSPGPTRS